MDKVQQTYPTYSNREFMKKCVKALTAKTMFATKPGVRLWFEFAERFTANREEATVSFVRGFPSDADFITKFRFKPSKVLLSFMLKRFMRFDEGEFERTSRYLKESQERLIKAGIFIPGQDTDNRTVWPFPIVVQN